MLRPLKEYADIIKSYRVLKYEQFGLFLRLRLEVTFIDESTLYIRETIIGGEKRKYAYHWQDKDAQLFIRWDNAPDWEVETFPHHKHVGKQGRIEPSYERTIEQVLKIIAHKLRRKGD